MRHDKNEIFELRRQGKSYKEISTITGASRGTLCSWFKDEEWSRHIKKTNNSKHLIRSAEHMRRLNEGRRILLEDKYKKVEEEAKKDFQIFKNDPLFMAGLMLYIGEGDKTKGGSVNIANTDFNIHKIFLKFIEKYTKTPKKRIKLGTLIYPDLNMKICRDKWSFELEIAPENLYKTQIIQGRSKYRKLHFGVGSIIICDSFLKHKIFKWIEYANEFLISDN